jgi:hypothetical protein
MTKIVNRILKKLVVLVIIQIIAQQEPTRSGITQNHRVYLK